MFAFQQPSASLIWRLDFALLIDVEGGYLVQPGVRYRPSDAWQWDLYANLIEDGGDENDDIMESLDFADEVFFDKSAKRDWNSNPFPDHPTAFKWAAPKAP